MSSTIYDEHHQRLRQQVASLHSMDYQLDTAVKFMSRDSRRFTIPRKLLKTILASPSLTLQFKRAYNLDHRTIFHLYNRLEQSALHPRVKNPYEWLEKMAGKFSTELQDYEMKTDYPPVEFENDGGMSNDVYQNYWRNFLTEGQLPAVEFNALRLILDDALAPSNNGQISKLQTHLRKTVTALPSIRRALRGQFQNKMNRAQTKLRRYSPNFQLDAQVAANLIICDVSGSIGRDMVESLLPLVTDLAVEHNAYVALVSDGAVLFTPEEVQAGYIQKAGAFRRGHNFLSDAKLKKIQFSELPTLESRRCNFDSLILNMMYSSTEYERLSPVLANADTTQWDTVITIADYDGITASALTPMFERDIPKFKIRQLLDLSLVQRPTNLAQSLESFADRYQLISVY